MVGISMISVKFCSISCAQRVMTTRIKLYTFGHNLLLHYDGIVQWYNVHEKTCADHRIACLYRKAVLRFSKPNIHERIV